MARIRQALACVAGLLSVCGITIAAESVTRHSSGIVADDAAKKVDALTGRSNRKADTFPVNGGLQSAPGCSARGDTRRPSGSSPGSPGCARTPPGASACYYLAECQFQRKNYVAALESYERLHREYPATSHLDHLVSREYEIARFWLAQSDPRLPADQRLPWKARLDGRLPLLDIRGVALRRSSTSSTITRRVRLAMTPASRSPNITWSGTTTRPPQCITTSSSSFTAGRGARCGRVPGSARSRPTSGPTSGLDGPRPSRMCERGSSGACESCRGSTADESSTRIRSTPLVE